MALSLFSVMANDTGDFKPIVKEGTKWPFTSPSVYKKRCVLDMWFKTHAERLSLEQDSQASCSVLEGKVFSLGTGLSR